MNKTLLIVEDNLESCRAVREFIESFFPCLRIYEAHNGEAGVALASIENPGLVLMDIRLPDMNGIEAARRIKASLPKTEIIILTLYDFEDYRKDALQAGACAFIQKSRTVAELPRILKSLLGEQ